MVKVGLGYSEHPNSDNMMKNQMDGMQNIRQNKNDMRRWNKEKKIP
jgi:hypothetical protein